jgi:hypothetical protein
MLTHCNEWSLDYLCERISDARWKLSSWWKESSKAWEQGKMHLDTLEKELEERG